MISNYLFVLQNKKKRYFLTDEFHLNKNKDYHDTADKRASVFILLLFS